MRIVTVGGGTGQFHMLRALLALKARVPFPIDITAIPVTSDSGGSSGLLRLKRKVVAVGDISQCVFGLHPEPELAEPLFGHRFEGDESLKGHTTRNLIVLTYFEKYGLTQEAMDRMCEMFHLEGKIAPITFAMTALHARLGDGSILHNEHDISTADILAHGGIEDMWLEPKAEANQAALDAIKRADLILTCPGNLVCSLVPNFLVEGVADALKSSKALKVCVANLMNRKGHVPEHWSVLDHVEHLEKYLTTGFFDVVLCNTQPLSPEQTADYQSEKIAVPLVTDMRAAGRSLIAVPLLMNGFTKYADSDAIAALRSQVRHDPEKVARALDAIIEHEGVEKQPQWLILDFDRTVFDTDRFMADYADRIHALVAGTDHFTEGELYKYVFPDVHIAIAKAKERGIRVALLTQTSGTTDFQKQKAEAAGLLSEMDEILFVEKGQAKGKMLAERLGSKIKGVCVDDMAEIAESITANCPQVKFVQIDRRHAKLGDDVSSIEEVLPLFESM